MSKYQPKANNLDLLRLLLALGVVFIHAAFLFPAEIITTISNFLAPFSKRAVPGFFVLSGFLVYMSYDRTLDIGSYFKKRILRIYPAYVILILACVIMGAIISDFSILEYFNAHLLKYIVSNLFFLNFLQQDLPGVNFQSDVNVINGALWTLKIEVMFYVSVIFIWFFNSKINPFINLSIIFIGSTIFYTLTTTPSEFGLPEWLSALKHQLPSQLRYFVAGILLYLYFEKIKPAVKYLLVPSFITLYFSYEYLEPLAIAILIAAFFIIPEKDSNTLNVGDYSYGLYIYHFPVIQILTNQDFLLDKPVIFLSLSIFISLIAAVMSWHIIEKPALQKKSLQKN